MTGYSYYVPFWVSSCRVSAGGVLMVLPPSGGAFTKKKVENDRVSIIYPVVRVGLLRDRQVAF